MKATRKLSKRTQPKKALVTAYVSAAAKARLKSEAARTQRTVSFLAARAIERYAA